MFCEPAQSISVSSKATPFLSIASPQFHLLTLLLSRITPEQCALIEKLRASKNQLKCPFAHTEVAVTLHCRCLLWRTLFSSSPSPSTASEWHPLHQILPAAQPLSTLRLMESRTQTFCGNRCHSTGNALIQGITWWDQTLLGAFIVRHRACQKLIKGNVIVDECLTTSKAFYFPRETLPLCQHSLHRNYLLSHRKSHNTVNIMLLGLGGNGGRSSSPASKKSSLVVYCNSFSVKQNVWLASG